MNKNITINNTTIWLLMLQLKRINDMQMRLGKLCLVFLITYLIGCKSSTKAPDVSHIKIPLTTIRYEDLFFAVDTNQIDASLNKLNKEYTGFTQDFLFNILGISPQNPNASNEVKQFIHSYKQIYEQSKIAIPQFDKIEKEVYTGLQFVNYYFPKYKLPKKLITFIGPLNSYGNIITQDGLAIGLQLYLGNKHTIYTSEAGQAMYPAYVSRRFSPEYIAVNCMKNIIDDIEPNNSGNRPFIEQIIEQGKRLYLLNALLPYTADSLKIGYTQTQLEHCIENEKTIWTFFVQNNLLYSTDLGLIAPYITDGPKTEAFGEGSPGNIGLFTGWKIVSKWMNEHANTSMEALLKKNANELFQEAKYKP